MALQSIRDNLQGTIAKVIVGIIAVPFVVFGVEQLFMDGGSNAVAEVDGVEISEPTLMRAIYQQKSRLMAQMGEQIDPKMLDENTLRQPTLDQLIDRTVLLNYAQSAKLVVSDRAAEQLIIATEDFQENGKFSAQRYSAILANNSWTPGEYKQQLKDQMLISQLVGGLAGSAFVTDEELDRFARVVNERRDISFQVLPLAAARKGASVSDSEIKAHYEAHPDDFMTDELVAVEYVELTQKSFESPVSEEAVRKQYDEELAALAKKKERHAAHIFLPAADDKAAEAAVASLQQIKQRIEKGEDFAALAKSASQDKGSSAKGGDLGFSAGDTFPPAFEQALQALSVGQVSAPVRTEMGVHLIKLIEERGVDLPSFAASRDRIQAAIAAREAEPKFVAAQEKLADASFNEPDLKNVAQQLNLQVQKTSLFGRAGGDGVAVEPKVVEAAFADDVLKSGNNSEVIELDNGRVVVLRVVEHKEPQRKSLAEVTEQIRDTLLTRAAKKALDTRAADIAKAVSEGAKPAAVSATPAWVEIKAAARSGDAKADPVLLEKAFKLLPEAGKPAVGRVELASGDVAVVVVTRVVEGDPSKLSEAERKAMQGYMQRIVGGNAFAQLRNGLVAEAEIARH